MATIRAGLFREIVSMSFDTLRTSKMRSALTVLGVVIGITSIVGMTSLIRGFDESLRDSIRALGPNTVFVQKFSALSFSAGKSFLEVAKRPNITREDARAVAPRLTVDCGRRCLAGRRRQDRTARLLRSREDHADRRSSAPPKTSRPSTSSSSSWAGCSPPAEVEHRRQVVVLGQNPYMSLFPNIDPLGKKVRIGANEFTVIGVFGKRPSPGGFGGADDFVVIPFTAQEKFYGKVVKEDTPAAATSAGRRSAPR